MTPENENHHLSTISTVWSLVSQAHEGAPGGIANAQQQLIDRYGGAVRRYLLGVLRDPDAADELFQEFALRFVRGDLRGADPTRGRFRDFLKGVLYHLVIDYYRRRRSQPQPLPAEGWQLPLPDPDTIDYDKQALESWRDELMARSWAALSEHEQVTGQPLYAVLRCRAEHPELRSPQLAAHLAAQLGRPFTPTGLRQTLHRARKRFADLLLAEVAQSLRNPTPAEIEQELIDLGLREYCRPALERRNQEP